MAQSTIGQRGCDMFANTRGDKCANRWGVFDSCGTNQHLSDITVELTRPRDSPNHKFNKFLRNALPRLAYNDLLGCVGGAQAAHFEGMRFQLMLQSPFESIESMRKMTR